MNNKRRAEIQKASDLLTQAKDIVSSVRDEEEWALDNMPENLQGSERYTVMEEALDALNDAESSIEEACEYLDKASE